MPSTPIPVYRPEAKVGEGDPVNNRAAQYIAEYGKGKWRTARKTLLCQHWWDTECLGIGKIATGARYFDTQELDGSAGGFGTHRCCARCAEAEVPAYPPR